MTSEPVDTQPYERPYACHAYGLAAHCILQAGHHGDHIDMLDRHFQISKHARRQQR